MKTSVITLSLVLAASQLTLVPEAHAGRGNRALIGGLIGAAIGAAIYHNSRNKNQGGKKRQPQAAVNSDVYPRTLGNWTIDYDAENRICLASSVSANGTSYHIGMAAKDGDWFFSFTNPDWKAIEEGRVYQNIDYVFDRRKGFNGESTGISNGLLIDGLNEEFVQHFARANKLAVHLDKNPVDEVGLRGTKNAVGAIRHCTKQAQKQQPAPVMVQDPFNKAPSPGPIDAFAAEQPIFPVPPAAPPPVATVAVAQAAPVVPLQQVELDSETAAEIARLEDQYKTLYQAGRYSEALVVGEEIIKIKEDNLGVEHLDVGNSVFDLASAYTDLGGYQRAESLYKRSLIIYEKTLGLEHERVATNLNDLAFVYDKQNRFSESVPLYEKSIKMREKLLGKDHVHVALSLSNLAWVYEAQSRIPEAIQLRQRALTIHLSQLGEKHEDTITNYIQLGDAYRSLGQYTESERYFTAALTAIGSNGEDKDSLQLVSVASKNLADLYLDMGRYSEAENLLLKSLAIEESITGRDQLPITYILNSLGVVFNLQGERKKAEEVYSRVLDIRKKVLGPEHPDVATAMNNYANELMEQKRFDEAEILLHSSIEIRRKHLGNSHPLYAQSLNNLAAIYQGKKQYEKAENLYLESLEIRKSIQGSEHIDVTEALGNLAMLYSAMNKLSEADSYFNNAYKTMVNYYGDKHPYVNNLLHNWAVNLVMQERNDEALQKWLRILKVDANQLRTGAVGKTGTGSMQAHAGLSLSMLPNILGGINRFSQSVDAQNVAILAIQILQLSETTEIFEKLARRLAISGNDDLAGLVRKHQDVLQKIAQANESLLSRIQYANKQNQSNISNLRTKIDSLNKEEELIRKQMDREYPAYREFTGTSLTDISNLQKVLAPKEAALAWVLDAKESYLLIVPKSGEPKLRALPVGQATVQASVDQLHQALDLAHESHPGQLARFPAAKAHELFGQLFGTQWQQDLEGIEHLLLVPEGPLGRLPFAALLTDTPAQADFPSRGEQYPQAPWLAKRFGLSVLPSLSSIVALRSSTGEGADKAFLGIGDPLLDDHPAKSGKLAAESNPGLFRNVRALKRVPDPAASPDQQRQQLLQQLRSQPSLPDTAAELEAIAAILGSDKNSALLLRERANEFQLKQTPLHGYQVISFATHGVLAGELGKGIEPGLILTPPDKASAEDDGFLSLSEVAGLKLNADWVVLSACNTAAGAEQESEGLTGLAKAFIYAGAKSLLVSHWAVSSQATVGLMQGLFQNYQKQNLPKHKAHQQAMLSMINSGDPQLSHPSMWAPFVLVGADG